MATYSYCNGGNRYEFDAPCEMQSNGPLVVTWQSIQGPSHLAALSLVWFRHAADVLFLWQRLQVGSEKMGGQYIWESCPVCDPCGSGERPGSVRVKDIRDAAKVKKMRRLLNQFIRRVGVSNYP